MKQLELLVSTIYAYNSYMHGNTPLLCIESVREVFGHAPSSGLLILSSTSINPFSVSIKLCTRSCYILAYIGEEEIKTSLYMPLSHAILYNFGLQAYITFIPHYNIEKYKETRKGNHEEV